MIEVDARGLSCPIPVVKTIKAMEEHPQDVLQVLVDNSTARENILRLGTNRDYTVSVQEIAGEWHLKLTPPA